jgi:hypothetical protein
VSSATVFGQEGRGFSRSAQKNVQAMPDSLLKVDSTALKSKRIVGYKLTQYIGDSYIAPIDSERMNYGNSTLVEAKSLAVGYLANLGSPAQTRIFSERKEARDFMYADAYDYYITTPENAYFYDTKTPYTEVIYSQLGAGTDREDQLKAVLTWNMGKKINVGADVDYIYGRGQYWSNGNKLLSYRVFGSYRSDKYELNAYAGNFNFVNYESGGLANDRFLTNPEDFSTGGRTQFPRKEYPVRYYNTWNRVAGKQAFLTHRYNLGFTRELEETDEDGIPKEIFVPVSSIIHTVEYNDYRRRFISNLDKTAMDSAYLAPVNPAGAVYNSNLRRLNYVYGIDEKLNDVSSSWQLDNTFALSMREGFQDWAKFGFTAFARFENKGFKMPARIPGLMYDEVNGSGPDPQPDYLDFRPDEIHNEYSLFLGADLSKRKGSILTYNARGELGMMGADLGEVRISGDLQTKFLLFGKDITLRANGHFRNVRPGFFQQNQHSRYYWWDEKSRPLNNTQQFYAGGEIHLESTGTTLSTGVESIQNYLFFNKKGLPEQYDGNIQVISARLKQNFYHKGLGWENEAAYQLSSETDVLPLPALSIYSNLYVHFKLAKVLTMQVGADVHYNTKYYAPYYEPATQQFQIQNEKMIGNYPLINGYINFHLKQTRFFAMFYNVGSSFIDEPAYFSLLHYPLNPMTLKLGVAILFNN